MISKVLLERVYPGHTRLLAFVIPENRASVMFQQTTGAPETLAMISRQRLRAGDTPERFLEQELLVKLLARGYRLVPGQDAEVEALGAKLAADVERERLVAADELATTLAKLQALPNVTVTRGTPMSEAQVAQAEAALGIAFPPTYRHFLTTVGSLRASYLKSQRAELWIFGSPFRFAEEVVTLESARDRVSTALQQRRTEFEEDAEGLATLQAKWAAEPKGLLPFLTTTNGYASDLGQYDGFPPRSEPGAYEGEIYAFDATGRVCQVGLRYAEVKLEGAATIWDDFADVVFQAAARFEQRVNEWESPDAESED